METRQDTGVPHVAEQRSAVEARQGVVSGRVFTVLVLSLILAIIAMAAGWYFMH